MKNSIGRHVAILALIACNSDSPEEELARLVAESDTVCWSYNCYGPSPSQPSVPVEQGVACLNDALASGANAVAMWTTEEYGSFVSTTKYLFTVAGEVKFVTKEERGEDPVVKVRGPGTCTGPVRVGGPFCGRLSVREPFVEGC